MVHINSSVSDVRILLISYDIHIDFIWQIPTNAGKKPDDHADTFIRHYTHAYDVVNNHILTVSYGIMSHLTIGFQNTDEFNNNLPIRK